jgi:hypothetical protein
MEFIAKPDEAHEGLDGTYLSTEFYPGFSDLLDMSRPFDPVKIGTKVSGPTWDDELTERRVESAPPRLDDLSAYQHRYWSVDFRPGQDSGDPDQPVSHRQADLSAAHTWSSELVDADGEKTGYHTVMLDVDHPVRVVPSSTPGHYHLYIDVPVKHEKYFDALEALVDANILERGYVEASRARGGTHVRLPWVKKADPVIDFFQSDEQAAELEAAVKANPSLRPDVLLAIPENLAIAIEQSKAHDNCSCDWRSMPDAQEPYDEHAEHAHLNDYDRETCAAAGAILDLSDEQRLAEQSKAGDVAPFPDLAEEAEDFRKYLDEVVDPQIRLIVENGFLEKSATPRDPIGGGAATRPREEIVEELKIRESVKPLLQFRDSPEGQTVEWDVTQYEVKYVNGRGVLRRKAAKTESTHPEA